ncbi:MAG: L,D-transpeptidase [Anaerolineae bacterium]|nr:L,D-transpeptidase [Anaerolineae bacterium]
MKRLFTCCLLLIFLTGTVAFARPAQAGSPAACSTITLEQPHSDACLADIAANPIPNLERPVAFDPKTQGVSHPRSVLIPKDGTPYPIAWMVRDWYYTDKPGVNPPKWTNDRIIRKATLLYVYATVKVKGLEWHMIGPDRWMAGEYIAVLHIPQKPAKVTGRWIVLDLDEQTLVAIDGDTPVFATLISAAYNGYGVTREGLFNIYARTRHTIFKGPPWAAVPEYVIDHVPDVMFFDKHIALHGAYWHDWFGNPRTHGCVNIPVGDEAWLWDWVSEVSDQWGPDENKFFMPHPEKAPFVYVYHSKKAAGTK